MGMEIPIACQDMGIDIPIACQDMGMDYLYLPR